MKLNICMKLANFILSFITYELLPMKYKRRKIVESEIQKFHALLICACKNILSKRSRIKLTFYANSGCGDELLKGINDDF